MIRSYRRLSIRWNLAFKLAVFMVAVSAIYSWSARRAVDRNRLSTALEIQWLKLTQVKSDLLMRWHMVRARTSNRPALATVAREILPMADSGQTFLIARNGRALGIQDRAGLTLAEIERILQHSGRSTRLDSLLVTRLPIPEMGAELVVVARDETGGLTAFQGMVRSLPFLLFTFAGVLVVVFGVTGGHAGRLRQLAFLTDRLGVESAIEESREMTSGHWDHHDLDEETNALARSVAAAERRLADRKAAESSLAKTRDSQTVSTRVRARLLPQTPSSRFGDFDVSGIVGVAAPGDGVWWDAFEAGSFLHVALGRLGCSGLSSVMAAAASKTYLAQVFRNGTWDLAAVAEGWVTAVNSCAPEGEGLKACLMRLDLRTGECEIVRRADAPPPILIAENEEGARAIATLESKDGRQTFTLVADSAVVLSTFDHLDAGQVEVRAEFARHAKRLALAVFRSCERTEDRARAGVVVVRKRGWDRSPYLMSEDGRGTVYRGSGPNPNPPITG